MKTENIEDNNVNNALHADLFINGYCALLGIAVIVGLLL